MMILMRIHILTYFALLIPIIWLLVYFLKTILPWTFKVEQVMEAVFGLRRDILTKFT